LSKVWTTGNGEEGIWDILGEELICEVTLKGDRDLEGLVDIGTLAKSEEQTEFEFDMGKGDSKG